MFISALLFFSLHASAQETSMELPTLFCQVDQFSPAMNAAPQAIHKKCDSLRDAKEVKVDSSGKCKDHAIAKLGDCKKRLAGEEKVAVRWKLIEKFKITSNTTKFQCELDKSGESSCP